MDCAFNSVPVVEAQQNDNSKCIVELEENEDDSCGEILASFAF